MPVFVPVYEMEIIRGDNVMFVSIRGLYGKGYKNSP